MRLFYFFRRTWGSLPRSRRVLYPALGLVTTLGVLRALPLAPELPAVRSGEIVISRAAWAPPSVEEAHAKLCAAVAREDAQAQSPCVVTMPETARWLLGGFTEAELITRMRDGGATLLVKTREGPGGIGRPTLRLTALSEAPPARTVNGIEPLVPADDAAQKMLAGVIARLGRLLAGDERAGSKDAPAVDASAVGEAAATLDELVREVTGLGVDSREASNLAVVAGACDAGKLQQPLCCVARFLAARRLEPGAVTFESDDACAASTKELAPLRLAAAQARCRTAYKALSEATESAPPKVDARAVYALLGAQVKQIDEIGLDVGGPDRVPVPALGAAACLESLRTRFGGKVEAIDLLDTLARSPATILGDGFASLDRPTLAAEIASRGEWLSMTGGFQLAVNDYEEAIRLDPSAFAYRLSWAEAKLRVGRPADVLAKLEDGSAKDTQVVQAAYLRWLATTRSRGQTGPAFRELVARYALLHDGRRGLDDAARTLHALACDPPAAAVECAVYDALASPKGPGSAAKLEASAQGGSGK